MKIAIDVVGICAPGMLGWEAAQQVLRGDTAFNYETITGVKPQVLPANERRRATTLIKLALQVACEVTDQGGRDASNIPSVFTSSMGDMEITDKICRALAMDEKPVSPTQFHNSVHNAPAGYWSIATASRQNSISLSAGEASFAAGLLEAACLLDNDTEYALLVAYDVVPPEPLREYTGVTESFAVAMLLSRDGKNLFEIETGGLNESDGETCMADPVLEKMRRATPAAASLPLLTALAANEPSDIVIPYIDEQCLKIRVTHAR